MGTIGQLEHRRANQRLTLRYKSVHKLIAVDTELYQTKPTREGVSTRKHSSISFEKLPANKDCYKYSLYIQEHSLNGTASQRV